VVGDGRGRRVRRRSRPWRRPECRLGHYFGRNFLIPRLLFFKTRFTACYRSIDEFIFCKTELIEVFVKATNSRCLGSWTSASASKAPGAGGKKSGVPCRVFSI
jgi:hypothetical protein